MNNDTRQVAILLTAWAVLAVVAAAVLLWLGQRESKYCPECGAVGTNLRGCDICTAGHVYPTEKAVRLKTQEKEP